MKKINCTFKTAFLTEPGSQLENNDYYACIELDDYACYVLADGITDASGTGAAKMAVETILTRFQENPSIKRQDLHAWLDEGNAVLLDAYQYNRLKASVMVVVTDYENIRYGYAGNVRMRLFRNNHVVQQSADMSLAQQMVNKEEISEDALARHAQRHNLSCYLGQEDGFKPYISNKTPLMDADIITMYTRGVWENVSEGELIDLFSEATDQPEDTLNSLEDMLLSKNEPDIENYSMVLVYVDTTFKDPKRDERRRLYKKIAIITVIILIIIGIIYGIWHYFHQKEIEKMQDFEQQAVASLEHNNFKMARDKSQKAEKIAEALDDSDEIAKLNGYISLIDSITQADEAYNAKDYSRAYLLYEDALDNSRSSDGLAKSYIGRRMADCEKHLSVTNLIALGDNFLQHGDLAKAEAKYLEAQAKALTAGGPEDQQKANAALMQLNAAKEKDTAKKKEEKKEQDDKAKEEKVNAVNDMLTMAQAMFDAGDLDGADLKLKEAMIMANQAKDDASKQAVMALQQQIIAKRSQDNQANEAEAKIAEQLVQRGDAALAAGDMANAKLMYEFALDKYYAINDETGAIIVNAKLKDIGGAIQADALAQANTEKLEKAAENAFKTKNYEKAKGYYKELFEQYTKAGDTVNVQRVQRILDEIDTQVALKDIDNNKK